MKKDNVIYFKEIDILRFFAFLMVFSSHFFAKVDLNISVSVFGLWGVDLFFVISSFLIFYLLIKEQDKFNSIEIKKFFIRRVLRIWPLYYLSIILAYMLTDIKLDALPSFLTFNYNHFMIFDRFSSDHEPLTHLWSLCLEEQFYLIAPLIVVFFNSKSRNILLISLLLVPLVVRFVSFNFFNQPLIWSALIGRADPIIIGGLIANNFKMISTLKISPLASKIYSSALIFIFIAYNNYLKMEIFNSAYSYTIISIIFGLILIFSFKGTFSFSSKNISGNIISNIFCGPFFFFANELFGRLLNIMAYLGKISFGLYLIHLPLIKYIIHSGSILEYFFVLALSIIMAAISYNFIELPTLNLKAKFALIKTRI